MKKELKILCIEKTLNKDFDEIIKEFLELMTGSVQATKKAFSPCK